MSALPTPRHRARTRGSSVLRGIQYDSIVESRRISGPMLFINLAVCLYFASALPVSHEKR